MRRLRRAWRSLLRGVTGAGLLEIMIATVVVAIVAVGLVEFFAKGRIWFDQEERKRVATQLAQEAMERTVTRPYAQIVPWNESRRIASIPYGVAVQVLADNPERDMKTVQAVVSWPATSGVQRNVSLATFVTDL